ncbi:Nuclear GTPase SLIP-GC, partial [Apaloderma vittatum]
KDVQNKLKDILDKSVIKLLESLSKSNLPERRNAIEYLKNRLSGMKPDVVVDPIYIGVFGSTGAGKSTLLNAIMDKNFFLPVSGSKACTSCVVQVGTGLSRQYEAKIHLLTDEEWKEELKGLVALAEPDEDDDDYERNEAVLKISTIYGEEAERKSYEDLCSMKPIVSIPSSRCVTIKATTGEDLSDKMNPYIRIQSICSDANEGTSEEDRNTQLWPLVKNVEVTVPKMKVVPEGVVFMDIPGTGDVSSKRDAMWKENINKCSVIWVVTSIERIQGQKTHEMMLKEAVKAFQGGMCRDISLVVTKSDQMDLNEYKWERKKGDINKHDAILERNEMVKQEKGVMMKKNLEKKLPSDSEVLHKDDLVYTVSAWEYWNGDTLTKEETEVPKLREYIQKLYEAQKRNVLMDNVEELWVIFSLIQSIQSQQDAQHLPVKRILLQDFIEKFICLGEDIEKYFEELEQPLHEGVAEAKRLCNESIKKILKQVRDNRGFHKTLKAVCLNSGVYMSKIFGRIDINRSLAQPIYDSIDMSFGNIFRIQMGSKLKVCLDTFKDNMKEKLREA